MASKIPIGLIILALAAVWLVAWDAPATAVAAVAMAAPTPTPLPIPPARVGSNASLAIGALLLVVIILFGVLLNIKRKK